MTENQQIKIEMPKLHKGQLNITKNIFDTDYFYYLICCSRQFGKTFLLQWLMLYYALKETSNSYFISPYYSQARKSFREMLSPLQGTKLLKHSSLTELTMTLWNGSTLYFKGSENTDALRGISPNYLYLDEFAFIKSDAWNRVLRPSLNVAGRKCFIASTPRTKQSDFYKMYIQGLEKNKRYKSYKATYKDNPLANKEEIEDAKRNLPSIIYEAEYEANFIESGGEVFSNLELCATLDNSILIGEKYYAGIDLGRVNDYTVLTIMNSKKEVVFVYRENQKDWNTIIFNLVSHLKRYNVKKCFVELNNVGDVVYDMLKKELGIMIDGSWTGKNKQDLIESLVVEFQNMNIKILRKDIYPEMFNELSVYSYSFNPKTRTIKYEAPQGFHDDCVMSLSICLDCWKKFSTTSKMKFYSF